MADKQKYNTFSLTHKIDQLCVDIDICFKANEPGL